MAYDDIESLFRHIVNAIAADLKPSHFKRNGLCFRHAEGGNVSIIAFQRSGDSNASSIKFTLNLGVVSKELLRQWDPERMIEKEGIQSAHLRERIGSFLPVPQDHWWVIDRASDVAAITKEVSALVRDSVIPFLKQHHTDRDLLALWNTGRSPGLTEAMRIRNVAALTDVGMPSQ